MMLEPRRFYHPIITVSTDYYSSKVDLEVSFANPTLLNRTANCPKFEYWLT
uniref:Uncharacterized protein n=1 Tax=Setaria italica TaxID=4555 RepID=K4ANS8_SETIT